MKKNRLKLNFSLETSEERSAFLSTYLEENVELFEKSPLTEEELETMGNYVLWGKNKNGKNLVQEKLVEIKTKSGIWDRKEEESFDSLIESPTFSETQITPLSSPGTRVRKEVFSREEALREAPAELKETFKELFSRIDHLELTLNFWDLNNGKRKNPPREDLLSRFSAEEISLLKEKASSWNQFHYLKMRHLLVELRREQFSLRDTFKEKILRKNVPHINLPPSTPSFDSEIPILPLGLISEKTPQKKIFSPFRSINPAIFSEKELREISTYIWKKKDEEKREKPIFFFDFRDPEHVFGLFSQFFSIQDSSLPFQKENEKELFSSSAALLQTLQFYIQEADLTEAQSEILQLKIQKKKNEEIAAIINQKFQKTYTTNYISTIFHQKIITKINEAAALHERIISQIFFQEEFKTCSTCGTTLLRDLEFFVKKTRAKDGLTGRCKCCDKLDRERRKTQTKPKI